MKSSEEKIDNYKSQLDKAKEDYNAAKKAFEEEKGAQEEILKLNADLRKKTTEQVSS